MWQDIGGSGFAYLNENEYAGQFCLISFIFHRDKIF